MDLTEGRIVTYDEVITYAEDNELIFMETSAKTALNVDKIFISIAKKLPRGKSRSGADIGKIKASNIGHRESCCNNKE